MRSLLPVLAAVGVLATPGSAKAFSFGIGVEGGGTLSYLTSARVLPDVVGLILTQRFELAPVDLTLWEDANLIVVYDGGWGFIPVDLGLRVGLAGPVFRPYVGVLANDSISIGAQPDCGCGGLVDNVPGLGGDLGFDLAVTFLRFGLELRSYETLIPPVTDGHFGDGFVLQLLASVRAEF
jgi:hypothetical protein